VILATIRCLSDLQSGVTVDAVVALVDRFDVIFVTAGYLIFEWIVEA
jgi:hypothetical protein